jgi:RHS repeat-associated protein
VWADRDAEWQFDGFDRMKLEKRGVYGAPWTYAATGFYSRDFAVDTLGNWLSTALDINGNGSFASGERETRTFNQANELLSRSIPWTPATSVSDTYDDNGNLRTVATTVTTTSTTTYKHDAWNRLVTYDKDSVQGFTVRYYAPHWRAKVLQPLGTETRQYYDESWRQVEVRTRKNATSADSFNHTFYGKRHIDDVVAHRVDAGTWGNHSDDITYWHITDGQFSTRAIVKPSGGSTTSILMERVDYDAYGLARHHYPGDTDGDGDYDASDYNTITSLSSVTINGGTYNVEADLNRDGVIDFSDVTLAGGTSYKTALAPGTLTGTPGNNFGFGGYAYTAATGLYLVRNRWYDPGTGRWVQRDPAGYVDGLNLYEYCQGGPWDGLDPEGCERMRIELIEQMAFNSRVQYMGRTGIIPKADAIRLMNDVAAATRLKIEARMHAEKAAHSMAFVKAMGNAFANRFSELASLAPTFGFYDASALRDPFTPTQLECEMGYNDIYQAYEAATSAVVGYASGGIGRVGSAFRSGTRLARFANVFGKSATWLDRGNSIAMMGRGVADAYTHGLNAGNFTAIVSGGAGLLANGVGSRRPPKIHGNSLKYVGDTHVYSIRGPVGTHKIGESMQGVRKRDGASIRAETQVRELMRNTGHVYTSQIRKTFKTKAEAREYETRLIERFRRRYGQHTLPGNRTNR